MRSEELLDRLKNSEDNLVERKQDRVPREWRKAIVAFANSLSPQDTGYLFIGVGDRGEVLGVGDVDRVQKDVGDICDGQCYPSIRPLPQCYVLQLNGKQVVAVEIYPSMSGPHFSGPAYVRSGSRSIVANDEVFQELIDRRHSVARILLDWKRQGKGPVRVESIGKRLGDATPLFDPRYRTTMECTIDECNAHFVTLRTISFPSTSFQEPLTGVTIAGRTPDQMLILLIKPI